MGLPQESIKHYLNAGLITSSFFPESVGLFYLLGCIVYSTFINTLMPVHPISVARPVLSFFS